MKRIILLAVVLAAALMPAQAGSPALKTAPETKGLRILAVGNSFSRDAMNYLPDLLKAAGIKEVSLGNLFIPGCSLKRHVEEHQKGSAKYVYYKSTGSQPWTERKGTSLVEGLKDESWDIITIQQFSGTSGIQEKFIPWLDELIKIIREYCPDARIVWHQTWAYAKASKSKAFARYDRDQGKMHEAICDCVSFVLKREAVQDYIPVGTAVDNARRTRWNDGYDLTRDGQHLNKGRGRYLAACTWFETLITPVFGISVKDNSYFPDSGSNAMGRKEAAAFRKIAVKAAKKR